jgi:hypothetical protein
MFAVHCLLLLILVVVDPSRGASSSDSPAAISGNFASSFEAPHITHFLSIAFSPKANAAAWRSFMLPFSRGDMKTERCQHHAIAGHRHKSKPAIAPPATSPWTNRRRLILSRAHVWISNDSPKNAKHDGLNGTR